MNDGQLKEFILENREYKWSKIEEKCGLYAGYITKLKQGLVNLDEKKAIKIYHVLLAQANVLIRIPDYKKKVIAFGNTSGTGTTTFIFNLGVYLARHNKKVLLLDLCDNNNLTYALSDMIGEELMSSQKIIEIKKNLFTYDYDLLWSRSIFWNRHGGYSQNKKNGIIALEISPFVFDAVLIDLNTRDHYIISRFLDMCGQFVSYIGDNPSGYSSLRNNYNLLLNKGVVHESFHRCIIYGAQNGQTIRKRFDSYKIPDLISYSDFPLVDKTKPYQVDPNYPTNCELWNYSEMDSALRKVSDSLGVL